MPRKDLFAIAEANYNAGYKDGYEDAYQGLAKDRFRNPAEHIPKTKRKPSKYNLFVKAKSKGQKFKYQSGKDKGKLNMRKIGIAWRKTRR